MKRTKPIPLRLRFAVQARRVGPLPKLLLGLLKPLDARQLHDDLLEREPLLDRPRRDAETVDVPSGLSAHTDPPVVLLKHAHTCLVAALVLEEVSAAFDRLAEASSGGVVAGHRIACQDAPVNGTQLAVRLTGVDPYSRSTAAKPKWKVHVNAAWRP